MQLHEDTNLAPLHAMLMGERSLREELEVTLAEDAGTPFVNKAKVTTHGLNPLLKQSLQRTDAFAHCPRSITPEEINALPMLKFNSSVEVVDSPAHMKAALEKLNKESIVGLDVEFQPTQQNPNQPAMLQIAGSKCVYLFRFGQAQLGGLHANLKTFIENPAITKTGVGITHDLICLDKAYGFSEPINDLPKEGLHEKAEALGFENPSLRNLTAALLGVRVRSRIDTSKAAYKKSEWCSETLCPLRKEYAAKDAWLSRALYFQLQAIEDSTKQYL